MGVGAVVEDEAGQQSPGGSNRGMRSVAGNLLSDSNNVDWQWYDTGIAKDGTGGWDEVENTVVIQVDQLPEAGLGRSRAMSGPMRKADFEGLRPPTEVSDELPGDAHSENSAGRVNMRLRNPSGGTGSDILIGLRDNGNIIIALESAGHFVYVTVFSMEFGEEEDAEGVSSYAEDHWQFMWWQRAVNAPDVVQTAWSPGFASDLDLESWESSRTLADTNGNDTHPMWIMTGSADRADDGTITQVDNEVYREFGAEYSDVNTADSGDLVYDEDDHNFVRFIDNDGRLTPWIAITDQFESNAWVHINTDHITSGFSQEINFDFPGSEYDLSVYNELLFWVQPFDGWSGSTRTGINTGHTFLLIKRGDEWPTTHNNNTSYPPGLSYILYYDDMEGLTLGLREPGSPDPADFPNNLHTLSSLDALWRRFACHCKFVEVSDSGEQADQHLSHIKFFSFPSNWRRFEVSVYGR